MSIIYCEKCDKNIDTDFDAAHEEECGKPVELTKHIADLHGLAISETVHAFIGDKQAWQNATEGQKRANQCAYCEGEGKVAVANGEDDFDFEVCACQEL